MPAESQRTSFSSEFSRSWRITFSALGERHILPQQTKSIDWILGFVGFIDGFGVEEGFVELTLTVIACFIRCRHDEIELISLYYDRGN